MKDFPYLIDVTIQLFYMAGCINKAVWSTCREVFENMSSLGSYSAKLPLMCSNYCQAGSRVHTTGIPLKFRL